MIKNEAIIKEYFKKTIGSFFKILPLYEENNDGLLKYIDSLWLNMKELENVIDIKYGHEYIAILTTLSTIRKEVQKEEPSHDIVKSETFKGINIIKYIVDEYE